MALPGIGKTWLLCTFPRPNILDFDGKVGVARNPSFVAKYGIRSIEYQTFSEKTRLHGYIASHNAYDDACRYFDLWMAPGKRDQFDTWGLDSGTFLTEASRAKALIVLGGAKRSGTHDSAMRTGMAVMQQQDWGGERSLTEQFIRMVKDSGKNVVVNVHQKEILNDSGMRVAVKPLFTGASADVIPSMFKDVWHLTVQGAGSTLKRILNAEYDGIHIVRSELGIGVIENPDYDSIIQRIRERSTLATQQAITAVGASQDALVPAKTA